jgi:hypothetical protein
VNGLVLTSANIGDTFTILSSTGTLSGSFTNTTVTVGSDVFTVSYVGKTVVLTLSSVTGPAGSKSQAPVSQAAVASAKPASITSKSNAPIAVSDLRHSVIGTIRGTERFVASGLAPSGARMSELNNLRSWEHVTPVIAKPIAVAHVPNAVNLTSPHNNLAAPQVWVGESHPIGTPSTLAGWVGNSTTQRVPVKTLTPSLPRMTRR